MKQILELGSTFSKTIVVLVVVGCLSLYGIYLCQREINKSNAEEIVETVFMLAQQEKAKIDAETSSGEDNSVAQSYKMENQRYGFIIKEDATAELVKVETWKKEVSPGVCRALKKRLEETYWKSIFERVFVVDRTGEEGADLMVYSCPHARIPRLRFYVRFQVKKKATEPEEDFEPETAPSFPEVEPTSQLPPLPSVPIQSSTKKVTPSSYSKPSCPSGTSQKGKGGIAVSGCRCNGAGESWNGKNCEIKGCPAGSSKNASGIGDWTNVTGCRCNAETPLWSDGRCKKACPKNKILVGGKCICSENFVPKSGSPDICVECNKPSDCPFDEKCISNKCLHPEDDYSDCRWGICQTCDKKGNRANIIDFKKCEVSGLQGICNGNGTCYPTEGRPCSSKSGCSSGNFCNYGGTLNSSKRQQGKFGQTPNVCQLVSPQKFVHKKVTYYYNTEKDLKSWCRAANNKANCKWGYLAKPGAESWCASLGKRLLTRDEMAKVWDVLRKELPQTYTGYTYWVQEGVWLSDKNGRLGFGKGHPDGYGGRGGVVCR